MTFRIKEVKADTVYTMLAVHVPEIREPGSLLSLLTPHASLFPPSGYIEFHALAGKCHGAAIAQSRAAAINQRCFSSSSEVHSLLRCGVLEISGVISRATPSGTFSKIAYRRVLRERC